MYAFAYIFKIDYERFHCYAGVMRIKTSGDLGQLVRDQRRQRGWSQAVLAEKAGVSRLWIGQLEKGKDTVEFGLILRTLRPLGLTLDASKTLDAFPSLSQTKKP